MRFLPIWTQLKDLSNFHLLIFQGFPMRLGGEEVGKGIQEIIASALSGK